MTVRQAGMHRQTIVIFYILLFLLFVLAACQGGEGEEEVLEDVEPVTVTVPVATETAPAEATEPATTEMTTTVTVSATVGVTVTDKAIESGTVTVAEVVSPGPGWMVIHQDMDGAPGPVIGHTGVAPGRNENVVVEIDAMNATETLHAMLHEDTGTEGEYDFPGADPPVQAGGLIAVETFTVSGLTAGAGTETSGSPEPGNGTEAAGTPGGMTGEPEVLMEGVQFTPPEITVDSGSTVIWVNNDEFPHTVTSGTRENAGAQFDSGEVVANEQFTFTFEEAGTYPYFCQLHPGMEGIVVVGG